MANWVRLRQQLESLPVILSEEAKRKAWPFIDAVATVALVVEGGAAGVTHGHARFAWVVGAAATGLLQWFAGRADRRRREKEVQSVDDAVREERAAINLALGGTMMPLLRLLVSINEESDPVERHALEEGALQSVIAAVASSIGPDDSRACYFKVDWGDDHRPAQLVFVAARGRPDEPHTKFVRGTPVGDKVFKMLRDDSSEYCRDTQADPPDAWEEHAHQYRTFLSVPVRTDKVIYGMLTLDAPEPDQLDERRDVPLLVVLARTLAATRPYDPADASRTASFVGE